MDLGVGAVKLFNDPKDALAALKTFTPNIIISDIEMGDMDGFQFEVLSLSFACHEIFVSFFDIYYHFITENGHIDFLSDSIWSCKYT